MEKRRDISLKQDYVNIVTEILNNGTIRTGNSDIMQRLIVGKTRAGEVIKVLKSGQWNGVCRQCCSIVKSFHNIFSLRRGDLIRRCCPSVGPRFCNFSKKRFRDYKCELV